MKRIYRLFLCIALIMAFMAMTITSMGLTTITVKSIKADKSSIALQVGEAYTLKITFTPANTTQKVLTYATGNKKVAAVDKNGKITAVSAGKTVITVTSNSNKKAVAKCSITVTPKIKLGPATYHMWTYNNDDNSKALVAYATAAVKKVMPDITVEVEAIDTTDTAMTKFKAYIASNDVPQFFKAKQSNVDLCIPTGQIADLTELAAKTPFKDKVTGMGRQIATYKGKLYAFPDLALSCAMIYYNKGIFAQNGVKVPATYADFLAAVKAFRAKDITPISIAGKDKWFYAMFLDIFATRYDPISSTNILTKKLKFTDPPYIKAAAKIQELAKAGAFSKDVNLQDYAAADSAFQAGMSAMIVNGSWAFSTYDNKLKDNFGYLYFPVDDAAQAGASKVHWAGGDVAPAGMSINPKKFKNQAEMDRAVQFLYNWAQASCDYYGEKGNPITSMKTDKHPEAGFSANMQQWIKDFNSIQTSTPYVQAMLPNGIKTSPAFMDLLQNLSTGQYDSAKFCADAQKNLDDNQ